MKRFLTLIFSLLLTSLFVGPTPIQAATSHVIDDADLLTSEEERELDQKANQIAQDYEINVLILTTDYVGDSNVYARDYIERYGEQNFSEGYIGYCIDMSDRSYWIDGYGPDTLKYFDQSVTDDISSDVEDDLSDEDFAESMHTFLEVVDHHLAKETKKYGFFTNIILNKGGYMMMSIFGLVFAILIAAMMTYSKMHLHQDKKEKITADDYCEPVQLEGKNDQLIRTYQTRVPVPKANTSSSSGGGGASGGHVGSGGHF